MSALLRDIFTIPETTTTADYVLRLTESVDSAHLDRTLGDYVVTPELTRAFDTTLGLVAGAIADNTSRGAFLTGSFGSGKSHFMAVLYALLRHHPKARGIEALADPIARTDPRLQGKNVLPLTFHLLGATSFEQAIFDGYLRQVAELHPDAVPPLLHSTDVLLADADRMRDRMGDDAFFRGLGGDAGATGGDVWGAVLGDAGTWDVARYEAARAASSDDPRRAELIAALREHYFTATAGQGDHIPLDDGLTAISTHAASLGYDAVVLFLDELVLWLAFRIRDTKFFAAEAQKLTKLVEGGRGGRRIPLVSFVARQMDLRRWLADAGASGAEQSALEQAFKYQEGRFVSIRLGDDNLPYVANKRLLQPQDAAAASAIDRAFASLDQRSEAWDVLLDGFNTDETNRGADAAQFRLTYPFSPALVSTLRSLAGVMQRERTALKVMQQMLVDHRATLTIDDVIPVGDAFDYLVTGAAGDQPLDEASAALFRAAHDLYRDKLLPLIAGNYGLSLADVRGGATLTPAMKADLRLAKTLLLSAVAPGVPSLKGLTAKRLASLNHGSIVTMLPGGEAPMVLARLRDWSGSVPEIRIETNSPNPQISVQLSDVDYETVVDNARGEDNDGRRRDLIKSLIAEEFGVGTLGAPDMLGAYTHEVVWRGSRRKVDLVFGNVRDAGWLSDDQFRAVPGTWRFVIDHPFDEPGHSPAEDLARVDNLRSRGWDQNTIVWLPRFFSDDRMKDVSRLVKLNFLLDGSTERFESYASHLSPAGRVQTRAILSQQREALLYRVRQALKEAYDVESPRSSGNVVVDADHRQVLSSLTNRYAPRPPAGGTLRQGFDGLVQDAFTALYPGHPQFPAGDEPVRARELQAVMGYVEQALAHPENRVPLIGDIAAVRRVANPLGVGRCTEDHFLMGDAYFGGWGPEFERRLGARDDAVGPVTVAEVRRWIDGMQPAKGLATDVADLVVLAWASLRRRAWFNHGGAIPTPKVGLLRPEMELREQPMPSPATWTTATQLAGALFGVSASAYLTPQEVANLAEGVRQKAIELSQPAARLVVALDHATTLMSVPAESDRITTARATADLTDALRGLAGLPLIERLAAASVGNPTWAGRSLASAGEVAQQLDQFPWARLDPLLAGASGEGDRAARAAGVLRRLREALAASELVTPIRGALRSAEDAAFVWLSEAVPTAGSSASPDAAPGAEPNNVARPPQAASGRVRVRGQAGVREVSDRLREFVGQNPDADVIVEWRIE